MRNNKNKFDFKSASSFIREIISNGSYGIIFTEKNITMYAIKKKKEGFIKCCELLRRLLTRSNSLAA